MKKNNESEKKELRQNGQNLQNEIRISSLPAFLIDFSESVDPAAARRFLLYSQRIG